MNAEAAVPASESSDLPEHDRPKFLAIDFFCGAGGTTRGLLDAGGYVIAGVDKESACRRTYVENNRNHLLDGALPAFLERDIFERTEDYPSGQRFELVEELDALIGNARHSHPGVPLLFAVCAPCQPFTTLSRRSMSPERLAKREKDRNLLQSAAALIERYRPELVLSENVAGIRDPRYGGIWEGFATELSRIGYATGTRLVCVSAFGIAQYRKRSILIGARADVVAPNFIDESNGRLVVPDRDVSSPAQSVAEVIGHLPRLGAGEAHAEVPNHRARSLSALNIERLKFARPGETNRYMADTASGDLSLECHRRVNARLAQRCFNDVYTRMRADRPAPTITTKCHSISNGRFGHYDMDQLRGISLREAAALQSFADDYVFHPVERIEPIARMIGNAVPPKLARFFASYLVSSMAVR
ncbi:DNA cytosine methyltransferase [Methylorubrum rhodesianum]|uniref:DNA cytosine methyltransferase n=1 Tax=Methylorubrum rhodesianum TaxID=29427 RepID=UPI003D01F8A1